LVINPSFADLRVGGVANQRNHRVEIVEGDPITFQNVQRFFGLA
jgi:hypothetical protein